jgi:hypothetical protein
MPRQLTQRSQAQTFTSLDELEEVTVQRCRVLLGQKERVRGLTSYHLWIEAIN